MIKEGKYIYSIIRENENRSFGPIGINNREVNLVHYKDISVVVSNTPVINFDRFDKKELMKYVATHQKVNEDIMKNYDIVPMAFGIIAPSSEEALRILERAYLQFKTALREVKGKAEFVVQVRWDPKRFLERLANTNPEIRKLKQKVALKGNILGMPMKLKLGKLIQKEAEVQRENFIKDIQIFLNSLSHDSALNKLIEDDMIVNFSFLIERIRESELDRKMQELGKEYEGKLRFKYIGPMPPYSFVNINLSLGNFEIVNEARKLLELGEEATFNEIQKVYHTLAHQYHPDKHQQNEERFIKQMKKQMKKINQAYDILKSYCQSSAELAGKDFDPNQKYSFEERDIKKSILIH